MASAQLQDFLISFMPFERESFVPVCIFPIFFQSNFQDIEMGPRYENWLSLFYRSRAKTETRCISEPFEVQTKVGEVQTGTNDSFSNAVGLISIFLKMTDFPLGAFMKF